MWSDEDPAQTWGNEASVKPHAGEADGADERECPPDSEIEPDERVPEETGYGFGV